METAFQEIAFQIEQLAFQIAEAITIIFGGRPNYERDDEEILLTYLLGNF